MSPEGSDRVLPTDPGLPLGGGPSRSVSHVERRLCCERWLRRVVAKG
jgi:hypothetical protein